MNEEIYQSEQQLRQDEIESQNALENMKRFYKDNEPLCARAYEYYKAIQGNINVYVSEPLSSTPEDLEKVLGEKTILVLTVNEVEKSIFLHWLFDTTGAPCKSMIIAGICYNIASIENKTIVHVNVGRTGDEDTRRAINDASRIFTPSYLIMLGVCYGLYIKRHHIGSVFVSDNVTAFRINFRDRFDSEETMYEIEDEQSEHPIRKLTNTIRHTLNFKQIHSILSTEEEIAIVDTEVGKLLSINSLVSSRKVKQAVINLYSNRKPKPLGGEMEAAGILKSNLVEDGFQNWFVIKSVCDWGEKKNALDEDEKKNDEIKDSLQAYAMANTCGVFYDILKRLA